MNYLFIRCVHSTDLVTVKFLQNNIFHFKPALVTHKIIFLCKCTSSCVNLKLCFTTVKSSILLKFTLLLLYHQLQSHSILVSAILYLAPFVFLSSIFFNKQHYLMSTLCVTCFLISVLLRFISSSFWNLPFYSAQFFYRCTSCSFITVDIFRNILKVLSKYSLQKVFKYSHVINIRKC